MPEPPSEKVRHGADTSSPTRAFASAPDVTPPAYVVPALPISAGQEESTNLLPASAGVARIQRASTGGAPVRTDLIQAPSAS